MTTLGERLVIGAAMAGSLLIGCSNSDSGGKNTSPVIVNPMAGSAGMTAAGGTAGAAMGGMPGGGMGGGMGGAATDCATPCAMGAVCSEGMCVCPPYAPDLCEADNLCTDHMDDPDHCGDCMTACMGASTCAAGLCTPEPTELYNSPNCTKMNLLLDTGVIYLVDNGNGAIRSVPVTGGAATDIATALTDPGAFVMDATSIYFTDMTNNTINKVARAGGTPEVLATEDSPATGLAVSGDTVYYTHGYDILTVPTAGGASSVLKTAIDMGTPEAVIIDGTYIIWAASNAFNVESELVADVVTDGGVGPSHVKLGASQAGLIFGQNALYSDGTNVYWVNASNILRSPFTAPMGENIGSTIDFDVITAYAIDGTSAYWATPGKDTSGHIEKAVYTMDPVPIARNQGVVSSMVVDDTNLYWANDACQIMMVAK